MPRKQNAAHISYRSISTYLSSTRDVLHSQRVRWGVTDEDIELAGRALAEGESRLNDVAREVWMLHDGDKAAVAAAVMDAMGVPRSTPSFADPRTARLTI